MKVKLSRKQIFGIILVVVVVVISAVYFLYNYSGLFMDIEEQTEDLEGPVPFGLVLNYGGGDGFIPAGRSNQLQDLQTGVLKNLKIESGIVWNEYVDANRTRLIFQTRYKKCGHLVEKEEYLPFRLNGLSPDDAAQLYPGWQLVVSTPEEIVLYREVNGICSQNNHLYLGIEKGRVAVFNGLPGKGGKVSWITLIPVHNLPPAEIRSLEKGVLVANEEELYGIIEGLASSYRD